MTIPTTYSELQDKVVDLLKRTGDSTIEALAPDWIGYVESELQTKIKLLDFETTATVTITAGVGTLPTGYVGMRSVYWDGSPDHTLDYITPDVYDSRRGMDTGDGYSYTIRGGSILTTPMGDGSLVCSHLAKFTPLSVSNTSNALLTNYPDLYVYGAAKHGAIWIEDDNLTKKFGLMFNAACDRINLDNEQRKYGHALAVKAR